MTKVLIVSDSHGLTEELLQLKAKHSDVDVWLHCGDSELSREEAALDRFVTVRGNCDYEAAFHQDELISIEGTIIFLTHGHMYQVKSTLMKLKLKAEEHGAGIVCFGHSHLLGVEMIDGILYINPGSLRLPRGRTEHTYVILEFKEQGMLECFVYDFYHGELESFRQKFHLSR